VFRADYPSRVPGEKALVNVWAGSRCDDWKARKRLHERLPERPPTDGADVMGQVEAVMRNEISRARDGERPLVFASFVRWYDDAVSRTQAKRRREEVVYDDSIVF